jgi:hypothetical protein
LRRQRALRPWEKPWDIEPWLRSPWELRIGGLRVYFFEVHVAAAIVTVRAVGVKMRERVVIGGVEVDLT